MKPKGKISTTKPTNVTTPSNETTNKVIVNSVSQPNNIKKFEPKGHLSPRHFLNSHLREECKECMELAHSPAVK